MEMHLDDCPFCNTYTVFKEIENIYDKNQYQCGCRTLGCRGNLQHSPLYYIFENMWKKWNRRGVK